MFLAIKILLQVSEVISSQVGFSKEQKKTHLKIDLTSFEQNKCYIFPEINPFTLYQYHFLHYHENKWYKT